MTLVIQHDLSKLDEASLSKYLRDVSTFIGLDPDLNALDTIWMENENGPGKALVVYARRGTAEILRNKLGIEVTSLTQTITPQGSIVFTATGKNERGRQEIAIGSKYIATLSGKPLDDAIMTASTRAVRRLTMQFTSLGILDESEVGAIKGTTANPAAGATLAGSPVVLPPPPQVAPNNAPGRDITPPKTEMIPVSQDPKTQAQVAAVIAIRELQKSETPEEFSKRMQALRDDAKAQLEAKEAGRSNAPVEIAPATEAAKPKRARKARNTVSMDGPEPEVVSQPAPAAEPAPQPAPAPAIVAPAVPAIAPVSAAVPQPAPVAAAPPQSTDFPGKPSEAQMGEYRKRVSVYTSELPSSENMGSVQKMRAFITKLSGTAPQFMTVDQWQEILSWFESYTEKNKIKGLVAHINESLGVK